MALIRTRVNCNALCASRDDQTGKLSWIRVASFSGIANQRDLIQIYTKARHGAIRLTDSTTMGFTGTS